MNTEQPTPPAVVLSIAQLGRLEEAVGNYWDCAYQEGHLNRPDGDKANEILHEIRCAVAALVAAEREACAKMCDEMADWPFEKHTSTTISTHDYQIGIVRGFVNATNAIRARSNAGDKRGA